MSAGPYGMGNVTERAGWPTHVVWVQCDVGQPVRYGNNQTFGQRQLAHMDWAIVKSAGPYGMGTIH